MTLYKCKICGWTQSRIKETLAHIEYQHKPETLIEKTDTLGKYD